MKDTTAVLCATATFVPKADTSMNSVIVQKCHQSKTEHTMSNMDASDRPKKRMRSTINELEKSSVTLQFLHRLGYFKMNKGRDENYESAVSEMLLHLEASASIDLPAAQKLHKIFLVNIGFSLKLGRLDQTLLLSKCLHALYRCTSSNFDENWKQSTENCYGKHEIEEAFVMILQGLEGLKGKPSRLNASKVLSIKFICLQIIHQLMFLSPGLREMIRSNRSFLESILCVIVSMPECSKCKTERPSQSKFKKVQFTGILSMVRSLSPTAMRLGGMVECIVSGNHQRVRDLVQSSKADQVFYIKCLLINGAPKKCMEDSKLYEAISFTKNECLGENHLPSTVDCFCLMVDNWNMTVDVNMFFDLIVEMLLERAKENDTSSRISVKCFEILIRTFSTRRMILEFRGLDSVVQFLLDVVFDETKCENTEHQAADAICLLALTVQKSSAHNAKEQCDPYRLLSSLLSSDNRGVLCKAVSSTHALLKATNGTEIKHDYCCNLILLLADASLRGFGPKAMQHEVVDIFQLLVKGNDTILNFMTRQPSALSLIVHAASAENCVTPRQGAFSLLLQMSKSFSNHRIMARQPGLLSVFFRHARNVSSIDDQRKKAKGRAMCLVKAL